MGKKPEAPVVCHHRTLAKGSTAHVQSCVECGTLSVHVGAISLRFDPSALESLWNTLGQALMELHDDKSAHELMKLQGAQRRGDA